MSEINFTIVNQNNLNSTNENNTENTVAKINAAGADFTPRQIVAELDKYIIGQEAAKKAVAIALRNRWRRQNVNSPIKDEIMPNNIIMIGPTGVGKTEIARRLAKLAGAPFIKVEATKFTEVGYVGRDVESMVRDLVEKSVAMVKEEQREIKEAQAEMNMENRILDILVPPVQKTGVSFDLTSESEITENNETREKFRDMLRKGILDNREIEIELSDSIQGISIMGPMGNMDDMGMNLSEVFGNILPKKKKKRKVKVADARNFIKAEEVEKLIDNEAVTKEALFRAENLGIIFIDEIDKVASRSNSGNSGEVSREGVQRDLLPIVEGSNVNTKYGPITTDHVLFIASGAFHVSKPSDLIPELQGRFPIRVELSSLTEDDFIKILTQPKNALIKQYIALMDTEGINLTFDESGIKEIAATAAKVNDEVTNIGARRLHTILTTILDEILFNAPDNLESKEIIIDAKKVNDSLGEILKNQDLSKYIL
ncbi:MAG: ATP-dependent protease ATPase subunit HslU [Candidatus Kapaibacteriota bacterium]|jgi:ATP-dependent HslUV protease ATP-binding subunit HslU